MQGKNPISSQLHSIDKSMKCRKLLDIDVVPQTTRAQEEKFQYSSYNWMIMISKRNHEAFMKINRHIRLLRLVSIHGYPIILCIILPINHHHHRLLLFCQNSNPSSSTSDSFSFEKKERFYPQFNFDIILVSYEIIK